MRTQHLSIQGEDSLLPHQRDLTDSECGVLNNHSIHRTADSSRNPEILHSFPPFIRLHLNALLPGQNQAH